MNLAANENKVFGGQFNARLGFFYFYYFTAARPGSGRSALV